MKFKLISYEIHYGNFKVSSSSSVFNPTEVDIVKELGMFCMSGEGIGNIIRGSCTRVCAVLERKGQMFDISISNPEPDFCDNIIANVKDVDFLLDRPMRFEQFIERLM